MSVLLSHSESGDVRMKIPLTTSREAMAALKCDIGVVAVVTLDWTVAYRALT